MEKMDVLLVGESSADARMVQEILDGGSWSRVHVWHVLEVEEAFNLSEVAALDVVLLFLPLPGSRWKETLSRVRPLADLHPLVVVTGEENTSLALEALRGGAQDYLLRAELNAGKLRKTLLFAMERSQKQRKAAEHLVRSDRGTGQKGNRYQDLFSNVPMGLYVSHPDGSLLDANPALVRMLGYPDKKTLLRVRTTDLYVDEDERRQWRKLMKAHQQVYQFETVLRRYDGELIWVLENTHCVVDETGMVLRYEGTMEDITSGKKTRERNHFLARMLNAVNQAVIATDPGGVISYWGKGAEKMFGWMSAEVMGRNINQVTVPLTSQRRAVDVMEALRNGYSWSGEMELIRKDGSAFDAIVSNSPVFNDTGNLESIIGVSTDITERRKAEGALEESEKKYRGLFESLPIGLYQSDPSRTLLSINPAALEILGFSQRDELIGEPVMNNFLHEEEREEWLRITANNERVRGYETRIIQPNGSLRWVRLNSRQVKDAHNNVVYFEGSLEDISHQKESDEQISRQMEGLKFLSDTAMEMIQMETPGEIYRAIAHHIHQRLPQAVVVVASFDAETRLARLEAVNGVDHQWEKLRELLGQDPLGMQFEVDNQEQQALLNQYFVRDQEESDKLFQKWFGVDTSEELIRLLHLDNLYGMGLSRDQELFGSVNISLPVGMDLSEREVIQTFITQSATALKKVVAERKLSKQNDDLEEVKKQLWESNQHLEEVNRELNQQQQDLKEALEKAEESDRLKSNFLANLSHEIRTPMNAILGFTHLLKIGDPAPDRKQQFLDIIYSKGEQLMQLINDIIDISKIQSHQFEINWQPLNMNHLFGELEMFYSGQMYTNLRNEMVELRFKSSMKDEQAWMVADNYRLEQILTNLVNNALKFTRKGYVEVGYLPQNQDNLLFYVQDTGIGIERDKHHLIFDRFRQADESTTRDYGGTGLGLTIVKNLVEMMEGTVWVESEQGKGSTFYFVIPWRKPEEVPVDPVSLESRETLDDWGNRRVVIASDDPESRSRLEKLLIPTGVSVIKERDVKDCLKVLEDGQTIDLIFMDTKMVGRDGYDGIKQIRQRDGNVPIVAFNSLGHGMMEEDVFNCDCDAYLSAPFEKKELVSLMGKYFRRSYRDNTLST